MYTFSSTNQDSSPANTPLSRAKRSVMFADLQSRYAQLDIRLYAPSVDWKRKVGSEDIGAEFGMSGTHGMQLEISKFSSQPLLHDSLIN